MLTAREAIGTYVVSITISSFIILQHIKHFQLFKTHVITYYSSYVAVGYCECSTIMTTHIR